MAKNTFGDLLQKPFKQTDLIVATIFVVIVLMIVIPLPAFFLDIMMAVNIALSVVILLTSVYTSDPLEFSVFPTLLLMTTLFALALNISSTRLILIQGPSFSVQIVRAFGQFVVGGNYVVGFIIFLIIMAVQFIVITRGASRISEVAARFKLEEYPNKNMSLENDPNLDPEEKAKRKIRLDQMSEFYGNMDGAAKFVQGNVIVSLIITVINLIGGIIIGAIKFGLSFQESIQTYALFTVGDGLVSQLPSLLISTASGIIITRSTIATDFAKDIVKQIASQPRAILIAAGVLMLLFFLPGFPKIPLFFLSAILGSIGYAQLTTAKVKQQKEAKLATEKQLQEKTLAMKPDDFIHVDPLEIEIGYSLIPLADQESGGDLLERITGVRRNIAIEFGFVIPFVRIRDNIKLDPSTYIIRVKGVEMGSGKIKMNHYLAIPFEGITEKIEGEPTVDPAFGVEAFWITESQRQKAELAGYTVIDPSNIITTHLTEIIRQYGYMLLGRDETQKILDNMKKTHPVLVEESLNAVKKNIGMIQKVLQNLLMEKISIRDMSTILETISDYGNVVTNSDMLTEYVRQSLKRQITSAYKDADNSIKVITLDPEISELLTNSIKEEEGGMTLILDPKIIKAIANKIVASVKNAKNKGISSPVIFVPQQIRSVLRNVLQTFLPGITVLGFSEVLPTVQIKTVEMVSFRSENQQ